MNAIGALRCVSTGLCFIIGAAAYAAELRGHGGAVRSIAVSSDAETAITGSFDATAIIWSLETGEARQVLLFHEGQVDVVVALPEGRYASAGIDGKIAIWEIGRSEPISVLRGHSGPVVALALAPDGKTLASGSRDATIRLWPLPEGSSRVLRGHDGSINALTFLPDGTLASAGYDSTVMLWPADETVASKRLSMPTPVNALATVADGRLFGAGSDGKLREIDRNGAVIGEYAVSTGPLIALATAADNRHLAVSALKDGVVLFDLYTHRPARNLNTAGAAVWALAFTGGGRTILAGGTDPVVGEWNVDTGQRADRFATSQLDLMAGFADNPDAESFRACIACHTLDPDQGNRAGPTLHGIFGRRIATVDGYPYSPALQGMDIVWTPETVSELFALGPSKFTPGTKMPEQTITDPKDRAALIRFLEAETGRK